MKFLEVLSRVRFALSAQPGRAVKRSGLFLILATIPIIVAGLAGIAHAQYTIEASAIDDAYDCQLMSVPGIRTVYVRESFNFGSTAARFKLGLEPGSTWTYVSETHPFPSTLGNTQTGISVCYGSCLVGNILIASVTYMSYGTDQNCSKVLIQPHPDAETVEIMKCDGNPNAAYSRDLYIETSAGFCGCPDAHLIPGIAKHFGCTPVATENSTWGAIKALYRQ
jgi:hypothetical protein